MISHIILDLSEVYVRGLPGIEEKIAKRTKADEKEIGKNLRGSHLIELFKGIITEEEYWREFIEKGDYATTTRWLKKTVRDNFTEIEGTRKIIEKLGEKFPLALLTDHAREWIHNIRQRHPIEELFPRIYCSFNTGYVKLQRRCYDHVLTSLDADPDKTLYIDDSAKNLSVARRTGIKHLHQFTTPENLEKELEKLKLL